MATSSSAQKAWIEQIFGADAANNGGIVRRSVKSVNENASEQELIDAVKSRQFKLIETGGQYVILCHRGYMQLV